MNCKNIYIQNVQLIRLTEWETCDQYFKVHKKWYHSNKVKSHKPYYSHIQNKKLTDHFKQKTPVNLIINRCLAFSMTSLIL